MSLEITRSPAVTGPFKHSQVSATIFPSYIGCLDRAKHNLHIYKQLFVFYISYFTETEENNIMLQPQNWCKRLSKKATSAVEKSFLKVRQILSPVVCVCATVLLSIQLTS